MEAYEKKTKENVLERMERIGADRKIAVDYSQ